MGRNEAAAHCLVAAGAVLLLGEGVEEGSKDGDGRADDALGGHLGVEDDARDDDDDDALEGVGDRVGDGGHLGEGHEGDLVVEVEGEAGEEGVGQDVLLRRLGGCPVPRSLPLGGLKAEHNGDAEEHREDVGTPVLVGGAHGLDPGLLHDGLALDALEGGGLVGDHGGDDGEPGERELLERGEGDTPDDGDEGGVHLPGLDVAGEDNLSHRGEGRLAGLEDLAEGNSAGAEGNDGAAVRAGGPEADGSHGLPLVHGHVRGLADAEEPEGDDPEGADQKLHGRHRPHEATLGATDEVEGLLVVDVVVDVAPVPEGKEDGDLHGLVPEGGVPGLGGLGHCLGAPLKAKRSLVQVDGRTRERRRRALLLKAVSGSSDAHRRGVERERAWGRERQEQDRRTRHFLRWGACA
mmetsp:Transcript_19731/g.45238  ORF Transcript_19731/g.45238 Transcript_19731/m.45238 type:complete len:407 (+) Transcript_19731:156-1376(+)